MVNITCLSLYSLDLRILGQVVSLYIILTTQGVSLRYFSPQQVVIEPIVLCGKVARLVPFIDGVGTWSSSQLECRQVQAHEDYTNDLRKRPNKGVFQWY